MRRSVTRSFGTPGSRGDNLAQAFKDEFRLLTQLHHPNLATVHDFGRCVDTDSFFFTQELVRGEDVSSFLRGASRELVVELFVQLENPLTRRHGGCGIGLSYAQRIVEAHGSRLQVRSRLGAGASFSFLLPYAPEFVTESCTADMGSLERRS